MKDSRDALRHVLATLAYRGRLVMGDLPDELQEQHPGQGRSAREILNHINRVLVYGHSFFLEDDPERPKLSDWTTEFGRFFDVLRTLDDLLAAGEPLRRLREENLLQGPLCDAMAHIGQISQIRNQAGVPVANESYGRADIRIGCIGDA